MSKTLSQFRIRHALAITLLIVLSCVGVYAQSNATPEARVKSFYSWYLQLMNREQDPTKNRAVMRSFLSARLDKWLYSKAGQSSEADVFIGSQEWSDQWADKISVGHAQIKGMTAVVNVTLGPDDYLWRLRINLVRESGVWKIDRVKSV